MRKLLKALLILLAVLLAVVIIYVGYVMLSYDRIPDNQELEIRNPRRLTWRCGWARNMPS